MSASRPPPLFTELRALGEVGAGYMAQPALLRLCPPGDGHPVLCLPPFLSGDGTLGLLRRFLLARGYRPEAWELGRNTGVRAADLDTLEARIRALQAATHARVSLIGHSLGGIFARILAHRAPESVRCVITLGSPFNVDPEKVVVRSFLVDLYQRLNPDNRDLERMDTRELREPPPVPTTAIYSEGDAIAPWRTCVDSDDALANHRKRENLRVAGSHTGLPFNPAVLYAIADRLAQDEKHWRPFASRAGARRFFFPRVRAVGG